MHGTGNLTYADGSVHENARWERGQRVGEQGTFRYKGGHEYQGSWANSTFQGMGKFRYKEGDEYNGQWATGERSGKGTYSHYRGDVYEGSWANDRREGVGEFKFRDGGRYKGRWRNDEPEQSGPNHWTGFADDGSDDIGGGGPPTAAAPRVDGLSRGGQPPALGAAAPKQENLRAKPAPGLDGLR